ncbi:unnamed protein product [Bursaphelenchus xylophilus]|uniref:(pine wood nematode) hypothetical protein n=1 Tax=Bursaphelenchus xylophilus TaxID=6326 RepID=A0A811M174_BURXY|nr:unnamed protein product [Bursaphelenchus xylophilus]CAG9129677.1 unnamed protein product [Bursaphelenchus xylophilus]
MIFFSLALQNYYFGIHIKSLAIFMTFMDLLINVFPAMLVNINFRIILFAITLGMRIPALYTVLVPKVKYLNGYKALLLITVALTFATNCAQIIVNFTSTNCQKIPLRNFFAVSSVICPLELVVFMTISQYINFVADQGVIPPPTGPNDPSGASESPANEKKMKEEINEVINTSGSLNTSVSDPNAPLLA